MIFSQPGIRKCGPLLGGILGAALWYFHLRYLAHEQPVFYLTFFAEDFWAESASCLFWFAASLFMCVALFRDAALRRPGFMLFALCCFLFAMEEISYGQRLIGYTPPKLFLRDNLQGEMNLHNFTDAQTYREAMAPLIVLCVLAPTLLALGSPRLRRLMERAGVPMVPVRLWPLFALVAAWMTVRYKAFQLPDSAEVEELTIALGAALLSLEYLHALRGGRSFVWSIVALVLIVGLLALPMTALTGATRDSGTYLVRGAIKQFVGFNDRSAREVFAYIAEHPEYQTRDSGLYEGLLLRADRQTVDRGAEVLEAFLQEHGARANPERASCRYVRDLGYALLALGRDDEAVAAFERALEIDAKNLAAAGGDPDAEYLLRSSRARTFLALGEPDAAAREQEQADALPATRAGKDKAFEMIKFSRFKEKMVIRARKRCDLPPFFSG